jgi:branched-chain amino acid transport system substrate-binding protein
MAEYGNGADNLDESSSANAIFTDIAALAIGTAGLEGDVTPESIIEAMKSMDNQVLPGTGGRQFRCNGNASEANPSVCMNSGLSGTLNAEGFPETYTVFNDEPIPD